MTLCNHGSSTPTMKVSGVVLGEDGCPKVGVRIRVEHETTDGNLIPVACPEPSITTGPDGSYSCAYAALPGRGHALRVMLASEDGTPSKAVISPSPLERVDFRLGGASFKAPPPRFTEVSNRLRGVLSDQKLDLKSLDAKGIARLALGAGVPPAEVVLAREAAASAGLSGLPESLFFALGKGGLSPIVANVLKHSAAERQRALDRAIAMGLFTTADAAAATAALSQLDVLARQSALEPDPTSVATPGFAMALAGVTDPQVRESILDAWASHQGTVPEFWSGLVAGQILNETEKEKLQHVARLQSLTRANVPLMTDLFGAGDGAFEDLVSLDLVGWKAKVTTHGVPPHLAAAGVDADAYAEAMFKAVEDALPTPMLRARSTSFASGAALESFLEGNPTYDLRGTPFRELLRQDPNILLAAGTQQDQDAVAEELPILERLYRISPRGSRFEVMSALRAEGIVSATQIQMMGRARFINSFEGILEPEVAETVFRLALGSSGTALMLYMMHGAGTPTSGFASSPTTAEPEPEADTFGWAAMFGGRTYCACGECQSAYGPAAYLADLLFWLDARATGGAFLDELLVRRTDLDELELSCKNAKTALPTIDLILEQLEAIAQPAGVTAERQTTLEEPELAARPEHEHEGAYNRLAGADAPVFYPFDQPYIASLDRSRTFFSALGADRAVAMLTLAEGGVAGGLATPEIAAEVLGMTRASWAMLTGQRSTETAYRWGLYDELVPLVSPPVWTQDAGATVTTDITDINGGTRAVRIEDTGASTSGAYVDVSGYKSGQELRASLLIEKQDEPAAFLEIGIAFDGGAVAHSVVVHPATGVAEQHTGSPDEIVAADLGAWWRVSMRVPGDAASSVRMKVHPALGAATGAATVCAPRITQTGLTSVLESVPTFLEQAGERAGEHPLTYAEVEDLLRSQFVQDAGPLGIWFDNEVCDIEGATLVSATSFDLHLDRLAKLIRLSRDLGWSIRDADRAIQVFRTSPGGRPLEESDISESLLVSLAAVRWLERMLGKSPAELLGWWGPLDTRRWRERIKDGTPDGIAPETPGRGRVFDRLSANAGGAEAAPSPFQRTVGTLDAGGLFAVTDDGAGLADESRLVLDHLDAVASVIGAAPAALAQLVSSDTPLTLATLSELSRKVSCARALGLTTSELGEWLGWTGLIPFTRKLENALATTWGDENLLAAPDTLTWSSDGIATVITDVADPEGGANAVTIADTDASAGHATTDAGTYASGSEVWASVFLKKSSSPASFAAIRLVYDGVETDALHLRLDTGGWVDDGPIFSEIAVHDVGSWWFVAVRHAGAVADEVALRVYPAAGEAANFPTDDAAATGECTVYGARIADATNAAETATPIVENPLAPALEAVRLAVEVRRQSSMRLDHESLGAIMAGSDERDLTELGVPTAVEAVLALSEEIRAHGDTGGTEGTTFDFVGAMERTLDDLNLLPGAPPSLIGDAQLTMDAVDPMGSNFAVTVADPSATQSGHLLAAAGEYVPSTPVWGSIWVKKDLTATHFAEVGIAYDSAVAARIGLDLRDGAASWEAESFESVDVRDAGGWWFLAFRHAGNGVAEEVALAVYPAAGPADGDFVQDVETIGSIDIFGARVADATLDASDPFYPEAERDRALIRRVGAMLHLDDALVKALMGLEYAPEPTPGVTVFEMLIAMATLAAEKRESAPFGNATPELDSSELDVWQFVALTGWMCRAFQLHADDLDWLFGSFEGGFDMRKIVFDADARERYRAWAGLREAARLQQISRDGRLFDLLGELLGGLNAPTFRERLAERTGWSEEDLGVAIEDGFTGPISPTEGASAASFAEPGRIARLAGWMELARKLGVSAASIGRWAMPVWADDGSFEDPLADYQSHAAEIEQTLRAGWGEERWLEAMPAVRDELRERQRKALISRIVGDPAYSFGSSYDLGEHLLMDIQMGACARTSRLKDAHRTVQVFVQRVLLGAEGTLRLTDEEADEWEWRKNYRVWEANRKVFLYPENWLRPELRKDKTPFFEKLEDELAEGDLREELVEGAYRTYLRQLASVSKLEALAVLREEREEGEDVYHVFARSRGIPQTYYHREWVDGNRWTPWRELPKVEGEHLLPVIYQRRLVLFWLNLGETSYGSGPDRVPEAGDSVPQAERYLNIRLSWSEYRDGSWSTPMQSSEYIGVNERGVKSPTDVDLADLRIDARAERRGTPPLARDSVFARAQADSTTGDMLIQILRLYGHHVSPVLPQFRVSAVDGGVTVHSRIDVDFGGYPEQRDGVYHLRGQRWLASGSDEAELYLSLPAHDGANVWCPVVSSNGTISAPWIQITPTDRVQFNPHDPFVFEDQSGSYWVTWSPQEIVPTSDQALMDYPLAVDGLLGSTLTISSPAAVGRAQIVEHGSVRVGGVSGIDGLVDDVIVDAAIGISGKVMGGSAGTELVADTSQVQVGYAIVDPGGVPIYSATGGAGSEVDESVAIELVFQMPAIVLDPQLYAEGVHAVRETEPYWKFDSFSHPHVGAMREALNRYGVFGLLDPSPGKDLLAAQNPEPESTLEDRYELTAVYPVAKDDLDFRAGGAYSDYNWELFFHAPFLIATRLHEAGRYQDALKWLKVIFDPFRPAADGEDATSVVPSYWKFRPFRKEFASGAIAPRNILQAIALLSGDSSDPEAVEHAREFLQQIADWRRNPFDPHAIARTRVLTYMTAVVMRYLEIILDWGDQLFAQDTLESLGEAAELYLLAARILGARPEVVDTGEADPSTFGELLEKFRNGEGPTEAIEEALPDPWELADDDFVEEANSLPSLLYFCTPANPQLTSRFWDRVADRLFKIRNCMNLQGDRRELALFEPPIDPDLLVRAAATGVDLQSLLTDVLIGGVPHRRYLSMAELAAGLAASAQGLGQALLGAIEKRDADQLSVLRTTHERQLQEDTLKVRRDQITEIEHQLAALRLNREAVALRLGHYKDRPRTNAREEAQLRLAVIANAFAHASAASSTTATILGLIPELDIGISGVAGTPVSKVAFGGKQLATIASAAASINNTLSGAAEREGRMLLTEAGYDRRKEDWDFQADLAQKDLDATDQRIAAMEIQVALVKHALSTAELRMEQIEEIQDFLERRFAGEQLYEWLASQLSSLHYQSYQLAYEFAKKAEKAWRYELGRDDSFIQFGYWEGHRKGILAAERLAHDLRRMQVAYTEISKRRLEVDQTFSLRDIDPVALLKLQHTGEAEITLPEAFFDLYYPGQYCRRIRAVRLTVPAVVPPNTNLPAHLSLTGHRIRKTADLDPASLIEGGYGASPVTMTATSTGQRDAGVFELDFRGSRLLPFEGAGAVSSWTVKLPKAMRPFDYKQIQDVLVHVAYDAEYSGRLRDELETSSPPAVQTNLFAASPSRSRVISLRQEHGGALRRIIQEAQATVPQAPFQVELAFSKDTLPPYLQDLVGSMAVASARIVMTGQPPVGFSLKYKEVEITNEDPGPGIDWSDWLSVPGGGFYAADITAAFPTMSALLATQTLTITDWGDGLEPADDFDILVVVELDLA